MIDKDRLNQIYRQLNDLSNEQYIKYLKQSDKKLPVKISDNSVKNKVSAIQDLYKR